MARTPLKQFTPKITGNRAGIGSGKKISHDGLLVDSGIARRERGGGALLGATSNLGSSRIPDTPPKEEKP
jgi:hypothetical protein